MQPFWDVLWSDATALAGFVVPMLLLSVPTSCLGAWLGITCRSRRPGMVRSAMFRGTLFGSALALLVSMAVEFAFQAEGLSDARRALRDVAWLRLCLVGPATALAAGFLTARKLPSVLVDPRARRRYTLRQLFVGQLIAGLLFGWWAFTRRDEIGLRRMELEWRARDREAKALFGEYGLYPQTWRDYDDVYLANPPLSLFDIGNLSHREKPPDLDMIRAGYGVSPTAPRQTRAPDEAMQLVANYGSVTALRVASNEITDEGLRHLAGAARLRQIYLESPEITDKGVEYLCKLPRLRYLEIRSPRLTGASLKSLASVKSLRFVALTTTQVTTDEYLAFCKARADVNLQFVDPTTGHAKATQP